MGRNEEWRKIQGFEGYLISSHGHVMSLKGEEPRILRASLGDGRYLQVHLMKDGEDYSKRIHRLVAEAFLLEKDGCEYVDHINGDAQDNRVENLRWVTAKENSNNPCTILRRGIAQHQYWEEHRQGKYRRWSCLYPGETILEDGTYQFTS